MDTSHPPGGKAAHTHKPEFIIIEDGKERIRSESGTYAREGLPPLEDVIKTEFPFTLRIMSLGFSIMMGIAALGAIIALIVSGMLYLLSFGYSSTLLSYTEKCFRWWKKLFVLSLGFFISVFSPSLGLTIIVVYFILQGEKLNPSIFSRVFQKE